MIIIRAPYPDIVTGGGTTRRKTMNDMPGIIGYHTAADPSTFIIDGSSNLDTWNAKYGTTQLTQATASRRLSYSSSNTNIGNKPGFYFNDNTRRMDFTNSSIFPTGSGASTILLLYRAMVNQGNVCLLTWGSSTGSWRIFGYGNSGPNTWAALANVGDHSTTVSPINATIIEIHTVTAGTNPVSTHYANGAATGNTKSFSGSLVTGNATATLGYTPYLGLSSPGVVLEAIFVSNQAYSSSQAQELAAIAAWDHGEQGLLASDNPFLGSFPTTTNS